GCGARHGRRSRHPASCAACRLVLQLGGGSAAFRGRHMRSGRHALAGGVLSLVVAFVASPLAAGSTASTLPAPTNVVVVQTSTTQARVTWDAVPGAAGYDVQRNGAPYGSSAATTFYDVSAYATSFLN